MFYFLDQLFWKLIFHIVNVQKSMAIIKIVSYTYIYIYISCTIKYQIPLFVCQLQMMQNSQSRQEKQAKQALNLAIDYEITNTLYGQGFINSIKQDGQNRYWKSFIGTETIRLKCKFKSVCKFGGLQIRVANVSMVEITNYCQGQEQGNQLIHMTSKQRQTKQLVKANLLSKVQTDQIYVDLHSYNKKQVQIYCLRFFGTIIRKKSKQTNYNANNSDDSTAKKLASQRLKSKNGKTKTKQKRLEDQQQNDKQKQLRGQKQEKIEKAEQKKQNAKVAPVKNLANEDLYIPEMFNQNELLEPEQAEIKISYPVKLMKLQTIKAMPKVTSKWLQNQRRMQINYGVKPQEKLSFLMNPKIFYDMKFCIANVYGQEKSKLVNIVKELGGIVRDQPSVNCIVATSNPKGSNVVAMARLMEGTKIIKSSYIQDCYKQKTKLKIKRYGFKPEQFSI